jgi:hypothetical protein
VPERQRVRRHLARRKGERTACSLVAASPGQPVPGLRRPRLPFRERRVCLGR